jgi:hypothetical protein
MRYKNIHRIRRAFASGSPLLFAGALAITSVSVAVFKPSASDSSSISSSISTIFLVAVLAGVILLSIQVFFEYRRRTYDPTWAIKFDEMFDSGEMKNARAASAAYLRDKCDELDRSDLSCADLDDIFDFFENIGFYMHRDQITPEVAHHFYHYWIRGYYSAGCRYVDKARRKEPARWEFVKILFDATNEIEDERTKSMRPRLLDAEGITEFLEDEINQVRKSTKPSPPT